MNTTELKYNEYISNHNGIKPTIVKAEIEWKDNLERHEYLISLDNLWIDDFPSKHRYTDLGRLREDEIFYHSGNLQHLFELIDCSNEDFNITRIIDFY